MQDIKQERERRRESLILLSFSIFSVFLMFVSVSNSWNPAVVPMIAAELAFSWWAYLSYYKDHMFRGLVLTLFASISVDFYAIHAENFMVVIPTLCVFAVLFSLYHLRPAMDIVAFNEVLLLLYHVFIKQTFYIPDSKIEVDRMELQFLSLIVLNILCYYSIRRANADDKDIEELELRVERTQKIKDDFVANTSHELRTPINTISGMSEILLQKNLPGDIHHDVLDIQMTGIELQTVVTDILDYAALEADTMELNQREYNITSTLNDVMNMTVFQNREKNLELIFDCDPSIPCLLYGDELQLRRILNNLIGNAIKFTNEGGVVVKVTYRKEDYGVNLMVSVKDTGIGLTETEKERIFQGFYQTDSDRNRTVEGMGLGLTITSDLIHKMGGFLSVVSTKGEGSTFSFSIPQKVVDDRPCIALTHPNLINAIWYFNAEKSQSSIRDDYIENIRHISSHLGIYLHRSSSLTELKRRLNQAQFSHVIIGMEEYSEDPMFFDEVASHTATILLMDRDETLPGENNMHVLYKPFNAMTIAEFFNGGDIVAHPKKYQEIRQFAAPEAKILVVDDNLLNLKVVEGLLAKYKIKITAATSGEEALLQIESKDYDFVFMDHMMPGMDGIECLHHIRDKQGNYFKEVPVIALTANAIAGSREMFIEEGFDEFVAKPIDNSVLNEVLDKFIDDSKKTFVEEGEVTEMEVSRTSDPMYEMEGIDMDTALTYCGGDMEDYIELARVFIDGSDKTMADLKTMFAQEDWKNYGITVHALKSTSRTIGAMELSDIAFEEEKAAKDGNGDFIKGDHEILLDAYRKVLDTLSANSRIGEQKEESGGVKTSLDTTEWKDLIKKIRSMIDTYEADPIMDYIDEFKDRTYNGKDVAEALASVVEKVEAFDFVAAGDALDQLGGDE